ncbi:Pvc16 family protein [Streptomyces sp. NPDC058739]|uniref:Pvc16 family protein n=1 Tax=Streptomyces sp. NPDC058739 TaxID=3346618 RepID=UPI003689D04E
MIDDVTSTLRDLIESRSGLPAGWVEVNSLDSGTNLTQDKLHICLYAIEEHGHVRNGPLVSTTAGYERPPLGLALSYVMTFTGNHLECQKRLARVAQVFHSTPRLGAAELSPAVQPLIQQLTVRLRSPSSEERTSLWTAYGRDFRLALYYGVEVVPLPPLGPESTTRVTEHRVTYAEVGR